MVFIDNWSSHGGLIVLQNQGRVTEIWHLFRGWSLLRGGLQHRFDCISNAT